MGNDPPHSSLPLLLACTASRPPLPQITKPLPPHLYRAGFSHLAVPKNHWVLVSPFWPLITWIPTPQMPLASHPAQGCWAPSGPGATLLHSVCVCVCACLLSSIKQRERKKGIKKGKAPPNQTCPSPPSPGRSLLLFYLGLFKTVIKT